MSEWNEPSAAAIARSLSESQRLYLHALTNEPQPAIDVREDVYGPDHANAMQLYWEDEQQMVEAGLIGITLTGGMTVVGLTELGSAVRSVLS